MLNKVKFIIANFFIIPCIIIAQEKTEKVKFVSEKTLHIKIGATFNYLNTSLYKQLNSSSTDIFTSNKNLNFNPSADIEFDNQFSKYIGVNISLGFMQTRHAYHYENTNTSPFYNTNPTNYVQDGFILCNIPHLNISPSFYISNTRFNIGFGLYKYYYSFSPTNVGNLGFNLNSEGLIIYSNAGITQAFDIKTHTFSFSVNYFGFTKKYDQGFQVAIGLVL